MRQVLINLYSFDELGEIAKERVKEKYPEMERDSLFFASGDIAMSKTANILEIGEDAYLLETEKDAEVLIEVKEGLIESVKATKPTRYTVIDHDIIENEGRDYLVAVDADITSDISGAINSIAQDNNYNFIYDDENEQVVISLKGY